VHNRVERPFPVSLGNEVLAVKLSLTKSRGFRKRDQAPGDRRNHILGRAPKDHLLNNFGVALEFLPKSTSPPRRSLPVRSRAPDSSGHVPGGTAAGEVHRRHTTTVEGQVDRCHTDMDATGVPGQMGGSETEGGVPIRVDMANGDICEQGDFFLSQDKVNLLMRIFPRNITACLDGRL
jgi:hypothetical protein